MSQLSNEGTTCGQVWQFKAMVDRAPSLSRSQLVAGLQGTRSIELPYPFGPVDWGGSHTTWGGQYWRVNQFFTACDCWRLVDTTFHPPL